jgi:hypothetical protein
MFKRVQQRNGRLRQGTLALSKSSFCDTALPLASDGQSFRHFNTFAASQPAWAALKATRSSTQTVILRGYITAFHDAFFFLSFDSLLVLSSRYRDFYFIQSVRHWFGAESVATPLRTLKIWETRNRGASQDSKTWYQYPSGPTTYTHYTIQQVRPVFLHNYVSTFSHRFVEFTYK